VRFKKETRKKRVFQLRIKDGTRKFEFFECRLGTEFDTHTHFNTWKKSGSYVWSLGRGGRIFAQKYIWCCTKVIYILKTLIWVYKKKNKTIKRFSNLILYLPNQRGVINSFKIPFNLDQKYQKTIVINIYIHVYRWKERQKMNQNHTRNLFPRNKFGK
jgi:hypothetical protein